MRPAWQTETVSQPHHTTVGTNNGYDRMCVCVCVRACMLSSVSACGRGCRRACGRACTCAISTDNRHSKYELLLLNELNNYENV